MKLFINFLLGLAFFLSLNGIAQNEPLKIGIVGLTHTHVHWILSNENKNDFKIVGIVETNKDLAKRYTEQHGYSIDLVYDTMEAMIEAIPINQEFYKGIYVYSRSPFKYIFGYENEVTDEKIKVVILAEGDEEVYRYNETNSPKFNKSFNLTQLEKGTYKVIISTDHFRDQVEVSL